jgi:UDP-galactopyranose mutase
MKRYDYLIVGCGFAGSVIAERISSVLNKNVLVIEKRNHIGGNCYDYKDENGIIVHKYGPHLYIERDNRYFQDLYQFVPLEVYTKIFENMLSNKKIKVILNKDFKELIKIDFNKKKIYFDNEEFKGKLIYTAMIDEFFDFKYGRLPYRSLDLKFKTVNKKYYQEAASINYPNDYDFTRITEFKHIHPVNVDKTTILKEYPKSYDPKTDMPNTDIMIWMMC